MQLSEAIARRRSCREFDDRPVGLAIVHRLLAAAQGVTGPEGKRAVPSAHALYPLRLFLVSGRVEGVADGVHAALPDGTIEVRIHDGNVRRALRAAALDDQPWIENAAGIIVIAADLAAASEAFSDQPPYGTRGVRYAYIEAGTAVQNIQLKATEEGLGSVLVAGFRDEATAAALGLDPPVAPIALVCFGWPLAR
jgi:SagB-type dehydrogenase family enzyme